MNKLAATLFLIGTLGTTGSAFADVDTITGLGPTRLDACTDAKQSAKNVTMPYNYTITSFGQCDCEKSTDNLWKCVVEYRSVHKDKK